MPTDEFIAAECAIRQLHARLIDAAWRQDAAAFAAAFTADGVWNIAGMEFAGRDVVEAGFARLLGACAHVLIQASTPILDLNGDTATSRTYLTEFATMLDGTSALTIGIYHDAYVREGGAWLLARHHFSLRYRGPVDLSAPFVDSPDYGPPPGMPAAGEPTVTRRKLAD